MSNSSTLVLPNLPCLKSHESHGWTHRHDVDAAAIYCCLDPSHQIKDQALVLAHIACVSSALTQFKAHFKPVILSLSHWTPPVKNAICAVCKRSFTQESRMSAHVKAGECQPPGFVPLDNNRAEIPLITSYQSDSNELETWERLLELFRSFKSGNEEAVIVRQRLEHYKTFKLAYLTRPCNEREVVRKLKRHLAELVLEWMILSAQKDHHLSLLGSGHRCLRCVDPDDKTYDDESLIIHVLCVIS